MSEAPSVLTQTAAMVDVADVREHPKNPRQGDVGAIYESIKANGFAGALLVQRSTGYIIAGNHTYLAAKHAGLTHVPVLYVDVDDERAERLLLAHNRTADQASYDTAALAAQLRDLVTTPDGLLGTGYSEEFLDDLLTDLGQAPGFDLDEPTSAVPSHAGGVATGASKQIVLTFTAQEFPLVRYRLNVARNRLGVAKDGEVLARCLADMLPDVDVGGDTTQETGLALIPEPEA